MHALAQLAIKAVALCRNQGRWATWRFVRKHKVPPNLYTKARVLDAAQKGILPCEPSVQKSISMKS